VRLSQINKSPLFSFAEGAIEFARGTNTIVYSKWDGAIPSLFLFSKDPSKFYYYRYALRNKFKYIPKIYALLFDPINNVYLIHRECCNPIVTDKKINRMNAIRYQIQHSEPTDPVACDVVDFFAHDDDYEFQFDFGTHWLMQTDRGKLVICDPFINRKY